MWERETEVYLQELRHWGFNQIDTWLNATDARDPFIPGDRWHHLGKELLEKRRMFLKTAQESGLKVRVSLTPNHVYLDQLKPELLAIQGEKVFGQLLCPSQPEARRIILENCRNWFRHLSTGGVHLHEIGFYAYDFGGCLCASCQPWIVTFANLCREIHAEAQRFFPAIKAGMTTWWWTPEDYTLFKNWQQEHAPGWLHFMNLHIHYNQENCVRGDLPDGIERRAFVHIGYGEGISASSRDIYGGMGPVIAPERLTATLAALEADGVAGFSAYSEGLYDDVNKSLLAGMASGRFPNADALLDAYVERYFEPTTPGEIAEWVAWLKAWGRMEEVDARLALEELEHLLAESNGERPWQQEQWVCKSHLHWNDATASGSVGTHFTREQSAAAHDYQMWYETLHRTLYRLGPVRHIINAWATRPPQWLANWKTATGRTPDRDAVALPVNA